MLLYNPPRTSISRSFATNPDDTCRLLLRTFVAQLAAATKISPQPRKNAAATKPATDMASCDTDDDVILTAGVLLSVSFLNECKKKPVSLNEAFRLVDG